MHTQRAYKTRIYEDTGAMNPAESSSFIIIFRL